ncbi:MAG: hypothetical protein JWO71_851 [Candidatus Acidoferrum typicum]|nr:hypothetical protein [Candidatus Acidoferrum typicum]
MSILASALRPFWAPSLNDVSGNLSKGLGAWLAEENYQFHSAVKSKVFTIHITDAEPFLYALAADINRTATAAFESISHATKNKMLPKSTAWILIMSYYGAFFAAHAVLRMLGVGFINLEHPHAQSINKIARLYGQSQEDVGTGNFGCTYVAAKREIHWHLIDSSTGGVHERFWKFFKKNIDDLATQVLQNKGGIAADNQQVSSKLSDLVDNLCYDSCPHGNWLSVVRNRVNYKHHFGAWYPYAAQKPFGTVEERLSKNWAEDPMTINLSSHGDRNLRRFQETCSFILGCCRVLASDMATRCSTGKSFHTYGWLALSRLVEQRRES